jgi:hypothetical protein
MRIEAIKVRRFVYKTSTMRDTDGHTHPGPERDAIAPASPSPATTAPPGT